ncbi:GNAT family N-acetyltransferase [Gynuella sunshinyii]|uniref:Acetyltransferase, including N-acetylase of ribosomal protein n=1 Tax=Gynuella sunshinyii YC6258 TaxID=1445510 RepID=A0A0C5VRW1_9GAMM|nr:GNAT family N-acetyltransferase [Gynuella sunshinyii]AJQ93009.1 acetyltransferase, including N-acetylase of ribosomal protein [Gynuella sunshinyii YC6258]
MPFPANKDVSIQPASLEYARPLYELINSDRTHLSQWMNWVEMTQRVEDTISYVQIGIEQYRKGIGAQYMVFCRQHLCGMISFNRIEKNNRIGLVGYWLAREFCGKGIMTTALRQLIEIGFDEFQLNKIEVRCAVGNHSSQAIPERLGFNFDGVLRENEYLNGVFVDHKVYSILRREYPSSHSQN